MAAVLTRVAWHEVVRSRLAEMGQGQRWLGERVAELEGRDGSYSQQSVSVWLSGERDPEPLTMFAIEQAIGLEPGVLSAPLGFVPTGRAVTVERAILDDDRLTTAKKRALLAVYREMRE